MADRRVTKSGKDPDGDITALCNPSETSWSPRLKANAIQDIEDGTHSYYAQTAMGRRVDIRVVDVPTGKYLRTDKDQTSTNNLDDLPDC